MYDIMYELERVFYRNTGIAVAMIVGAIAVLIGLFFLFRAITCWYLKINKLLKEQKKTNAYLERIAIAVERGANMPVQAPVAQNTNVYSQPTQSAPTPTPIPVPVSSTPIPEVVTPQPVAEEPIAPVVEEAPVAKTCQSCGSTIPDGASFCVQCGTPAN